MGSTDGVYTLSAPGVDPWQAYCDMENGGWTVVQRRFNGDVAFDLVYAEYVNGFGNLTGDHWLGLVKMHMLTSTPETTSSLRISVAFYNGTRVYQHYGNVSVGDSESAYQLRVTKTPEDMSTMHVPKWGMADNQALYDNNRDGFTTKDHPWDNSYGNCADYKDNPGGGGGGWWYNDCSNVNINAIYGVQEYGGIRMGFGYYVTDPIVTVIRN
jgi:hypothetical protein